MTQKKRFHLDKVKRYLDGVFALEPCIKSYRACAKDIYRVFSDRRYVSIRDVESWLRGLKLNVDYMKDKTEELARKFAVDISSLIVDKHRTESDVYWWALATAVWVYGGMDKENPCYGG